MLFIFIMCLIVCFLCLHFNSANITTLTVLMCLAISAVPVINVMAIVVGLLELALIARYHYNESCGH